MTREEVCATVGAPPDEPTRFVMVDTKSPAPHTEYEMWYGTDSSLGVLFGGDGRAVRVAIVEQHQPTFWERARERLGL